MTALTPQAARAAAEWILANYAPYTITAVGLRAEADRLENAAKTPGQVLCDAEITFMDEVHGVDWEKVAAAVIAHHVGPDRVVVERSDVKSALTCLMYESPNEETRQARNRLREALS